MAEINYKICDRCGDRISESRMLVQKPRKFKLFRTSPDPYGYWETEYEICRPCGDKLIDFMRGMKEGQK